MVNKPIDFAKGGFIKRGSSKIPIIEINNLDRLDDKVYSLMGNYNKNNDKEAIFPLERVILNGTSLLRIKIN